MEYEHEGVLSNGGLRDCTLLSTRSLQLGASAGTPENTGISSWLLSNHAWCPSLPCASGAQASKEDQPEHEFEKGVTDYSSLCQPGPPFLLCLL